MSLEDLGTYKTVKVARQGRHVMVILSRPHKSNSMNDDMWKELPQVQTRLVSIFLYSSAKPHQVICCRCSTPWTHGAMCKRCAHNSREAYPALLSNVYFNACDTSMHTHHTHVLRSLHNQLYFHKHWHAASLSAQSAKTSTVLSQVVLIGEGKNFCAGIDTASLKIFADFGKEGCPARGREQLLQRIKQYQNTITSMEQCRWPIIAAVHGTMVVLHHAAGSMWTCCAFSVVKSNSTSVL